MRRTYEVAGQADKRAIGEFMKREVGTYTQIE